MTVTVNTNGKNFKISFNDSLPSFYEVLAEINSQNSLSLEENKAIATIEYVKRHLLQANLLEVELSSPIAA